MPALGRSVVLVGLMGSGKSSVGKRFAEAIRVDFVDVDTEIEIAAARSIPEIFAEFGEQEFRNLETRVLDRLMQEEPRIIATGGGAFIRSENRKIIARAGVSIWIDADLETLWSRVKSKSHRPLLLNDDPKAVLSKLLETRNPDYAKADYRVISKLDEPHEYVIAQIADTLGIEVELA